jgi:hypothetical protein
VKVASAVSELMNKQSFQVALRSGAKVTAYFSVDNPLETPVSLSAKLSPKASTTCQTFTFEEEKKESVL